MYVLYRNTCLCFTGIRYSEKDCVMRTVDIPSGDTFRVDKDKVFVGFWTFDGGYDT